MAEEGDKYKVRLVSISNPAHRVLFNVTPEINENRNVNYENVDPIHMPGNIFIYGNTTSRTFNIVAKLISRNVKEATQNSRRLQLLRSWTMPYFGNAGGGGGGADRLDFVNNDFLDHGSDNILGSPPDVLYLNAYADFDSGREKFTGNLNRVPVIVNQLGNSYQSDVDYIPTSTGEPFPIVMSVDIMLNETHSPNEYNKFNLNDFRNGKLENF